ncbi:hypothetical protein CANCADRAFT_55800 [Tortispora caseinolytica NRRL Y-17796]|uniref:Uncharacterized protein n=1 Tax=Tortispora caseinolytica NRRL Y-17796 TaxID=767744 RepID=A0A1E4TJY7_9ASCO|nr:hypothetical protein CANCADRAFT_55800 [Tortispora caseinolytica NRRL Y-17796]
MSSSAESFAFLSQQNRKLIEENAITIEENKKLLARLEHLNKSIDVSEQYLQHLRANIVKINRSNDEISSYSTRVRKLESSLYQLKLDQQCSVYDSPSTPSRSSDCPSLISDTPYSSISRGYSTFDELEDPMTPIRYGRRRSHSISSIHLGNLIFNDYKYPVQSSPNPNLRKAISCENGLASPLNVQKTYVVSEACSHSVASPVSPTSAQICHYIPVGRNASRPAASLHHITASSPPIPSDLVRMSTSVKHLEASMSTIPSSMTSKMSYTASTSALWPKLVKKIVNQNNEAKSTKQSFEARRPMNIAACIPSKASDLTYKASVEMQANTNVENALKECLQSNI